MTKTVHRDHVAFYLNGVLTRVNGDDAFMMLAEWLRKRALKTGTKIVCAEGDCGACTVLRADTTRNSNDSPEFLAMNSCIALVAQMDGSHLVTIEGLPVGSNLSPIQKAMRDCHGSQCGFCTPGFVMALTGALEIRPTLDRKTAANYTTGNLCRCTGYSPILDAAISAHTSDEHNLKKRYLTSTNLRQLAAATRGPVKITDSQGRIFYAPHELKDSCQFFARFKEARIVAASTDLGVQTNKGRPLPLHLMSLQNIKELHKINITKSKIKIGARATLTQIRKAIAPVLPEFSRFLDLFASPQIKNVATLVGNLANASPIGDTLPFLLASDADVILVRRTTSGQITQRKVAIQTFFLGYKQLAIKPSELIIAVEIPVNPQTKSIRLFKASQRKDLDISAVSCALMLDKSRHGQIESARIALGGIAATPVRLHKVEDYLTGQVMTEGLLAQTRDLINAEIHPISDVRGSSAYRKVLVQQIFSQYVHENILMGAN